MGTNEKILGIDLGMSNSAACVFVDGKATMIPSNEGVSVYSKLFPSYVAFTEDGELLVGQYAKEQAIENSDNTISEIKRYVGTDYKFNIQGKEYTPTDISAMILQKIKRDAESFLGEPINKAVITVPANFNDTQRTATRDAGIIAGLDVVRLVNEPTAASIAYGLDKQQKDINILIFELGGGTLDITIIEFNGGIFEVKSTSCDTALGGTDMNNLLIKYLTNEFEEKHGIDLTEDSEASRRLREGAERAIIELSRLSETSVKLPFIAMGNEGRPLNLDEKITRSKLEELVRPIVERCGEIIDQAIRDADLTIGEIDKVILVGGPTRMPIVQDYVENYTGKLVERGIDPMECVARGAAIIGDSYIDLIIEPVDVTPQSLSTVFEGIVSVVIDKNTPLPVKKTKTYTTVRDNQTEILFEVVQGENKIADLNTHLGSFTLEVQPAPRGVSEIEVTFEIDENGILNVTALDKATGNEKSIEITSANKMTQAEIDEAIREAERNELENKRRAILAEARNEADLQISSAQNLINDSNFRTQLDADTIERIESMILELTDLKISEDERFIKTKTNELRDAVSEAVREIENNELENKRRFKLAEARNDFDSQIYVAQNLINNPNIRIQLDANTIERIESLIIEIRDLQLSIKNKTHDLRDAVIDAITQLY